MRRRPLSCDPRVIAFAQELEMLLLANRDELPRARNGRSIAPSCAYAAQVLKDIEQGRSSEVLRLVAVLITDSRDGNLAGSIAWLERLIGICRLEAKASPERPLQVLCRAEQRAHAAVAIAELDVVAHEDRPTLVRVARAAAVEADRAIAVQEECVRRLAIADGGLAHAAPDQRIGRPYSVEQNARAKIAVLR